MSLACDYNDTALAQSRKVRDFGYFVCDETESVQAQDYGVDVVFPGASVECLALRGVSVISDPDADIRDVNRWIPTAMEDRFRVLRLPIGGLFQVEPVSQPPRFHWNASGSQSDAKIYGLFPMETAVR